ncbi:PIN-like domain-containing protein [Cronobacter dublinensis]
MKSKFPGFYSTPEESMEEIWLSESTLFIFDTNCLLNLYRCEDNTREEILNVMRAISSRTWLPFQVGFEYQKNRRLAIEDSIASLKKIQTELESIYTRNILGGIKKQLNKSLNDDIQLLQDNLKSVIDEFINKKIIARIEKKEEISKHDVIRDSIDDIIRDNIGHIPTQDVINEIDKEGEFRYANKIPPGFSDGNKKDITFFSNIKLQNKFGDLYLWKEIINKAKSDKIKNIIFVCDDHKEDWWFLHSGKTHGPLASLKTEICDISKIQNFKLINQLTFLFEAKLYLNDINVSDTSLQDVKELSAISTPVKFGDNTKRVIIEPQRFGHKDFPFGSIILGDESHNDNDYPVEDAKQDLFENIKKTLATFHTINIKALLNIHKLNEMLKTNQDGNLEEEIIEIIQDLQNKRESAEYIYRQTQALFNKYQQGEVELYSDLEHLSAHLRDLYNELRFSNALAKFSLD